MPNASLLTTPRALGMLIKTTRRERGLDQASLARTVGVSRQWISEVENGKPSAELGLVLRTLRALGVQLTASAQDASGEDALAELLAPRRSKKR